MQSSGRQLVFGKYLEHTTSLLIDQAGNTLNTTTTSQTPDCWLGDTLDVVTEHLPVTLGASLSKTFASFASARHDDALFLMLDKRLCGRA